MDFATAVHIFTSAGGKARAKKLSAERRREIARNAANTRWKHHVKKGRRKKSEGVAA